MTNFLLWWKAFSIKQEYSIQRVCFWTFWLRQMSFNFQDKKMQMNCFFLWWKKWNIVVKDKKAFEFQSVNQRNAKDAVLKVWQKRSHMRYFWIYIKVFPCQLNKLIHQMNLFANFARLRGKLLFIGRSSQHLIWFCLFWKGSMGKVETTHVFIHKRKFRLGRVHILNRPSSTTLEQVSSQDIIHSTILTKVFSPMIPKSVWNPHQRRTSPICWSTGRSNDFSWNFWI